MIVIICSRYSGKLGFDEQKRDETEKASIETVLRRGRVLRGFEGATYEHICMANTELTKALPRQTKGLHPGYARHKLASILQNVKNGTQIVFVSLGLDGILSKRSGWDDLIEFQQRKGLETKLLIAEDLAQWYKAELLWREGAPSWVRSVWRCRACRGGVPPLEEGVDEAAFTAATVVARIEDPSERQSYSTYQKLLPSRSKIAVRSPRQDQVGGNAGRSCPGRFLCFPNHCRRSGRRRPLSLFFHRYRDNRHRRDKAFVDCIHGTHEQWTFVGRGSFRGSCPWPPRHTFVHDTAVP